MNHRLSRLAGIAVVLGLAALVVVPGAQASSGTGVVPEAKSPTERALDLMPVRVKAGLDIRMAYRRYALCAASNITPSGRSTFINGKKYTVGTGICPIITGWTVYNETLQGTRPRVKGPSTIWSSFGTPSSFPQYSPETGWTIAPGTIRSEVVGTEPNQGMANFWGFPCTVTTPETIDGTKYPMAMCAGPLMENINNRPVSDGATMFTNAPASADIPVGLAQINSGPLVGMETFFLSPFNNNSD